MTIIHTPLNSIDPNIIHSNKYYHNLINHIPQTTDVLVNSFKPKKSGKNISHIIFILDDSSSMQQCRESTISGFNEFLEGHRKDEEETGIKTFISLYKFDGQEVKLVIDYKPVKEVEPLNENTYDPNGTTNLFDAIGTALIKVNEQLQSKKKKKRDAPIITILTDGHENASKVFNNSTIKQMVEMCEGKNWKFMFLGANIDSFAIGGSLGFSPSSILQYDTKNMASTFRSATRASTDYKHASAAGISTQSTYDRFAFNDEERAESMGGKND